MGGRAAGAVAGAAITLGIELIATGELPPAEDILMAAATGAVPLLGVVTAGTESEAGWEVTLWMIGKNVKLPAVSAGGAVAASVAVVGVAAVGVMGWATLQTGARGISAHTLGAKGGWGNLVNYPWKVERDRRNDARRRTKFREAQVLTEHSGIAGW